jgi:hypothetical protein
VKSDQTLIRGFGACFIGALLIEIALIDMGASQLLDDFLYRWQKTGWVISRQRMEPGMWKSINQLTMTLRPYTNKALLNFIGF